VNRNAIIVVLIAVGVVALVILSQQPQVPGWRKLVNRAQGGAYGAR
jgi:hypothetical protein